MTQGYLKGQIWGTPEQYMEKINARRAIIGDFDLNFCFHFAGMPFEQRGSNDAVYYSSNSSPG